VIVPGATEAPRGVVSRAGFFVLGWWVWHRGLVTDVALVLSGPPGVGKTTVAWRVFDFCADAGDDPALIDLDFMGAAWPAPVDDPYQTRLKAANVSAVWNNFRAVGSRRLLLAGVVESAAEQDLLSQAMAMRLVVCRLAGSPDVLAQRIRGRGRDGGADLVKLIRRAEELNTRLAENDVAQFVVDTVNRSVDAIASEVLAHWNHLSGTPLQAG
jgi:hypothetical protein